MKAADASWLEIICPPLVALGLLLILLATTTSYAFLPGAAWKPAAALGIAGLKAAIVMLTFMRLQKASATVRLVAISGFAWLALLLTLSWLDYATRLS